MKNLYILLIAGLLIFNSCEEKGKALLPAVTGKAGEVILVIENNQWEASIGSKFRKMLKAEHVALPQPEPLFDLVNINHQAFGNIFKSHRNVIMTKISSKVKKAKITIKKDVWARPQIVISMQAPNDSLFNELLSNNEDLLKEYLLRAERDRLLVNYKKFEEKKIGKNLRKNHNISLTVPKGYKLDVDTNQFLWISRETPKISQGLFVYYYDYTDTNTFTLDYLFDKRDSVLKEHVPGSLPNSYMITERNFTTQFKEISLNDKYAAEVRSLWAVQNDYMGGPFVSLSMIDEKRNRVVTVEGYVFAPQYDKRNYLRQVEAVLYSLEIK